MRYAEMLGRKITELNSRVYLINTGWHGGPYGIGKRIDLGYTRAMVTNAISGEIDKCSFKLHQIFNLQIPISCPGIPDELLDPSQTWKDKKDYNIAARKLARLFTQNFEKFGRVSKEIVDAGPKPDV
jgi:phosphoenolpyruvate carboxykinase (ATP)